MVWGREGPMGRGQRMSGRNSTVQVLSWSIPTITRLPGPAEPHSTREPCRKRCDLVTDMQKAHLLSLLHFTELPRCCIFYKSKARPSISKKVTTGSRGVLA